MRRLDTADGEHYYSDPVFNGNEGRGDITEIYNRQAWPASDIWVGDSVLAFTKTTETPLSSNSAQYTCNEWLFLGRRASGSVNITSMKVVGTNATMFRLEQQPANNSTILDSKEVLRVKVTLLLFTPPHLLSSPDVDATFVIEHGSATGEERSIIPIPIVVHRRSPHHQILSDESPARLIDSDSLRPSLTMSDTKLDDSDDSDFSNVTASHSWVRSTGWIVFVLCLIIISCRKKLLSYK